MSAAPNAPLLELAQLLGVLTSFDDAAGYARAASREGLLATFKALGAPVESMDDVPAAVVQRRTALAQRFVEPVAVAWDGQAAAIDLQLPQGEPSGRIACELRLEDGETRRWVVDAQQLTSSGADTFAGIAIVRKRLVIPLPLPLGYHHLTVDAGPQHGDTLIITAPRRAFTGDRNRQWGVFAPLYALHSANSWGTGDFTDLRRVMDGIAERGGGFVGTLPFLAAFLDAQPYEPSPYSPASRLFWNEVFLDLSRVPEIERVAEARALLASSGFQSELARARRGSVIDYRGVIALKRRVLDLLSPHVFTRLDGRREALEAYRRQNHSVDDYARFRAATERRRCGWPAWPEPLRSGTVQPDDFDDAAQRTHVYAQWLAQQQLEEVARHAVQLYLDFPLGVSGAGYDVWRERSIFATAAAGGAPPDIVFTKGQNWGFPPLHPERLRQQRYAYFIAAVRHQLRFAGILRVDHVMGLHRLYWVPKGYEADAGVYVRYPADELYAILSLESHRHRTWIVGENLGTVPPEVNTAMAEHGVAEMYVVEYELSGDRPLRLPAVDAMASINTHDMPTFAAFWDALDVAERRQVRVLDEDAAMREHEQRQRMRAAIRALLTARGCLAPNEDAPAAVLAALHRLVLASDARAVLLALQDLWGETAPQNIPASTDRPNWQLRLRYAVEEMFQLAPVVEAVRDASQARPSPSHNRERSAE